MAIKGIRKPAFRMEEEGSVEYTRPFALESPRADSTRPNRAEVESQQQVLQELVSELIEERKNILADTKLSTKEKFRLLESNHHTLMIALGGHYKTFKSEEVVYAILTFDVIVLVAFALLNVFFKLPTEITLAFIGTALGGTIATIAQKLGKI